MNLGSFAGAAVQGYQNAEDRQLRQEEQRQNAGLRERQMKIQEADEFDRQDQRNRDKAMRDESTALFQKYYGDKTEQIGETEANDGAGGVMKIPTMKTTSVKPGQDTAVDSKWYADHLMITAKHSGLSSEQMAATADRVEGLRKTENGKLLDRVTSGDQAAMRQLLINTGKDPEGAKLDFRPVDGINQITLKDGTPLDLKVYAAANATAAYYASMKDAEHGAQAAATGAATRKNLGATTALHTNQAAAVEAETPSKIRVENARAGYYEEGKNSQRLDRAAAAATSNDIKQQAADDRRVKALTNIDPNSPDLKGLDRDQVSFLLDHGRRLRASGVDGDPMAQAQQLWQQTSEEFDTAWKVKTKGMSKKDIKEQYGDVDALKSRGMREALMGRKPGAAGAQSAPAPAGRPAAPPPAPAAPAVRSNLSGDAALNEVMARSSARRDADLRPATAALERAQQQLVAAGRTGNQQSIAQYAAAVAEAKAKVAAISQR